MKCLIVSFAWLVVLAGCAGPGSAALPDGAVCRSLDGRPLLPPPMSEDARRLQEEKLAAARRDLAARPGDREAAIWVGRRLGYLGRYHEAVAVYTEALAQHPDDPYLLRHRGHRYITLREFDRAIADLSLAAQGCRTEPDSIEPDGLPVPGRPPHSTLHFNVYYHLGLACFLARDFAAAESAWLDCYVVTDNDEARVAVSHWLFSVRMRLGDVAGASVVAAQITPDMDIVENRSYQGLCLLYSGQIGRDELEMPEGSSGAALAFGLAHHALVSDDPAGGVRALRRLAASPGWAAFGVIAAEAELADRGIAVEE